MSDRPVTPEVAGSSPFAPVLEVPACGDDFFRRGLRCIRARIGFALILSSRRASRAPAAATVHDPSRGKLALRREADAGPRLDDFLDSHEGPDLRTSLTRVLASGEVSAPALLEAPILPTNVGPQ
jgi:hypothetical protein